MRGEDLEAVQRIDRLSFSLPWPDNAYRFELFDNQASLTRVAEIVTPEGQVSVIGMIVVWLILDEAHIATLAVDPAYRRQGVARQLLADTLQVSIRQGVRTATLEVRAGNLEAQALYRRFGFDVVGRRPRYYRDNYEDALLMTVYNLGEGYLAWLAEEHLLPNQSPAPGGDR
jgi:ribosomal-protein-alanine N-acetyltransferase